VRAVDIPVSFDIERGYSDDPARVVENLRPMLDAGVVGINIEDGDGPVSQLAKKIEAIKEAASRLNVEIFVNARTDVYLADL
jgi:2-methylisocitrate lyase-like PEP mutase family enzyme